MKVWKVWVSRFGESRARLRHLGFLHKQQHQHADDHNAGEFEQRPGDGQDDHSDSHGLEHIDHDGINLVEGIVNQDIPCRVTFYHGAPRKRKRLAADSCPSRLALTYDLSAACWALPSDLLSFPGPDNGTQQLAGSY